MFKKNQRKIEKQQMKKILNLELAYEDYYMKLQKKTNNLRQIEFNLQKTLEYLCNHKHDIELEIKYIKFAKLTGLEEQEKILCDINEQIKNVTLQLRELKDALILSIDKTYKTKCYLEKVKMNIAIADAMEESAKTDNLTDCFCYLNEETTYMADKKYAKALLNMTGDRYE